MARGVCMCRTSLMSMALKMLQGHASGGRVKDDGTNHSSGSEWVGATGYEGLEHPGVQSGSDPSSQPLL